MKIKFTILGCGSSIGIPRIDGFFGKCNPRNKKNYRTRSSALISIKDFNILIDSSPDVKHQLLKNKITNIKKVFYTHMHADQTHGINELRAFYLKNKEKIDIYADKATSKYLKKNFKYCFNDSYGYPSILNLNKLKKKHIYKFKEKKITIESIVVDHGKIKSILYVINNTCAYSSDVSKITRKNISRLKNIKYFVIDCLRYNPHPSHFHLEEVLNLIKIIKPKKTILTNMNNEIDYSEIQKKLPKNVFPAYDGMSFLL